MMVWENGKLLYNGGYSLLCMLTCLFGRRYFFLKCRGMGKFFMDAWEYGSVSSFGFGCVGTVFPTKALGTGGRLSFEGDVHIGGLGDWEIY